MGTDSKPDLDLLVIAGHTAAGKTALAALVAHRLGGEIISADSRQVYRGMDLGTGKDYDDYVVEGQRVPAHLIDIRDAGERYSLFDFAEDCKKSISLIQARRKLPVLCGGTGLYIEAILKDYALMEVPRDETFRNECGNRSDEELISELASYGPLHNSTDTSERERLVRALEIARFRSVNHSRTDESVTGRYKLFCIRFEREERRSRITERLRQRLDAGMVDEVRKLLKTVRPEDLMYYGLEYRYLTQYCVGEISYDAMFTALNTAIHQFSKRQLTWFRGMENRGIPITWIPGELSNEEKIGIILEQIR